MVYGLELENLRLRAALDRALDEVRAAEAGERYARRKYADLRHRVVAALAARGTNETGNTMPAGGK